MPAYIAYEAVKPDLPGENGSSPGFLKYPSELKRAVPNKPVTSGKEVTAMTPLWGPAPPGLGNNSYFDANNERIGAPVRFNIVDGGQYLDKLGPLLAAGNVPELTVMMGWMTSNLTRFNQAADKLFEDLTPYLAGDKVKDFPMLANLPTRAWAYGVWNNQLKAVPYPGTGIPWALFYRKDLFDQYGVEAPKNMDDVLALGKQLTDPRANRWAFGVDGGRGGARLPGAGRLAQGLGRQPQAPDRDPRVRAGRRVQPAVVPVRLRAPDHPGQRRPPT